MGGRKGKATGQPRPRPLTPKMERVLLNLLRRRDIADGFFLHGMSQYGGFQTIVMALSLRGLVDIGTTGGRATALTPAGRAAARAIRDRGEKR